MKGRTLAIGDVHGGLKALKQVLFESKYNPKIDSLIFLGDYVDGWSESAEVIDFIIGLKDKIRFESRHPDSIICLKGNHDEWLKEFLEFGIADPNWLVNGGETTLASYNKFWETNGKDQRSLDSHRKFLNDLHEYYVDEDNRAFVHAGCDRDAGVKGTLPYLRLWDRTMWKIVLTGGVVKAHKELFIGHTPTEIYTCKAHLPEAKLQEVGKPITVPMNRQNVWNLDTGGGWGGKLTIMDIDTKEFWQSDFVKDLYPEEEGR